MDKDTTISENENPIDSNNVPNGQMVKKDTMDAEESVEYREFNEEFFDSLPDVFKTITDTVESRQNKVMLLLASIVASSSALPNYYGIYGSKKLFSNLYFYILASAGAGKGKITWVKKLIEPVSHFFDNPDEATKDMSKIDLASVKNLIASVGDDVHMQNMIIPGNTSSAAFIDILESNKGKGFMIETEGDTVANMFGSDYGNYSDMFRKAFEHETISCARKTDNRRVRIEHPQLSVIMTSTPRQLFRMISDAENGLFSRFMYMKIQSSPNFVNVFDNGGYEKTQEVFENGGAEVLKMFLELSSHTGVQFNLTATQQKQFLTFFNEVKMTTINFIDRDLEGSIHRLGSICFRLAMVMSIFRVAQSDSVPQQLECSDVDFSNAMQLSKLLIGQMVDVYKMLPNAELDQLAVDKATLYRSLPEEFETAQAKLLGAEFDLSERSVGRFLTQNDALFEKVKHGVYRKKIV